MLQYSQQQSHVTLPYHDGHKMPQITNSWYHESIAVFRVQVVGLRVTRVCLGF